MSKAHRSAVSGTFVTKEFADANPATTITEKIKGRSNPQLAAYLDDTIFFYKKKLQLFKHNSSKRVTVTYIKSFITHLNRIKKAL